MDTGTLAGGVAPTVTDLPWSIAVLDRDGRITSTSRTWDEFGSANGADPETSGPGADYLRACELAEDPAARAVADAIRSANRGSAVDVEVLYPCHSSETLRWFRALIVSDGVHGAVVVHRSVTDEVRAGAAVGDRHCGLLELDASLVPRYADAAWRRTRGGRDDLLGSSHWLDALPPMHAQVLRGHLALLRSGELGDHATISTQLRTEVGIRWVQWELHVERDGLARFAGVLLTATRTGGPRAVDGAPWRASVTSLDPASGLADEAGLRRVLADRRARQPVVALVVPVAAMRCDDDHLRALAARLSIAVGAGEVVACLGDRLVAILPPGIDEADVQRARTMVQHELADEAGLRPAGVPVALWWSEPEEPDDVFVDRIAGSPLDHGGLGAVTGDPDAPTSQDVLLAWRSGQLRIHYQPIVPVGSARPVAVEALLRWDHPDQGILPVGAFLGAALEAGLGGDLGWWALDQALSGLGGVDPGVGLFVNLAPVQFLDPDRVLRAWRASEAHAHRRPVTLEVTESALSGSIEELRRTTILLRAAGLRTAIDDFGVEHSGLLRLRHVPADVLKIDRSLVEGVDAGVHAERILAGAIALGASLGMLVVAEGIESPAELEAAARAGADLAQGHLLHRPMPAQRLRQLVD